MTITVNEGNAVYEETIRRWDDDPMRAISDEEQARIVDNIRRAFASKDLKVSFPDSPRQVDK